MRKAFPILSALMLVFSLVAVGPASAATGVITLRNGAGTEATAYSASPGNAATADAFNIVQVRVVDSDLSVSRTLSVRYDTIGAATAQSGNAQAGSISGKAATFVVKNGVIEGDTATTDSFTGDGSTTVFTLTSNLSDTNADGAYTNTDATVKIGGTATTAFTAAFTTGADTITFTTAPASAAAITVAYDSHSYDEATTANTPIAQVTNSHFTLADAAASEAPPLVTSASASGTITAVASTDVTLGGNTTTDVTIAITYDVANTTTSGTTKLVKLISTSDPNGLSLSMTETTPSGGIFQKTVALIDLVDETAINSEISGASLTAATSTIANLITALDDESSIESTTEATADAIVADWIGFTVIELAHRGVSITTSSTIATLQGLLVAVSHGDTLTASYTDASPAATRSDTASIDTQAPQITSASPTDNSYSADTTPTVSATVSDTDTGGGLTSSDIYVCWFDSASSTTVATSCDPRAPGITAHNNQTVAQGGPSNEVANTDAAGTQTYTISYNPSTARAEAAHGWTVVAIDKVGNVGSLVDSTGNTYALTLDVTDATVTNVEAGLGISTATIDQDNDSGTVSLSKSVITKNTSSILVTFSEALDTTSVAATDFEVSGDRSASSVTVPTEVYRQANVLAGTGNYSNVGRTVVAITLDAALTPAEKPTVTLPGSVDDRAGNTTTTASKAASDEIPPTLTTTLSATLGKSTDVISITVTANEAVIGTPTLSVGSQVVSVTSNGTNSWGASFTITTTNGRLDVTATASDSSGNASTSTDVGSTTTVSRLQADSTDPSVSFAATLDASSSTSGTQVEEGDVVFLRATFDDVTADNYTNDSYKTVALTSSELQDWSGTTVASPGTKSSTATVATTDILSTDSKAFVYGATGLATGTYKWVVTAEDSAGNDVTGTLTFAVIARQRTSVSLTPGWNLVSLPIRPSDASVNSVVTNSSGTVLTTVDRIYNFDPTVGWTVATYNSTAGAFEGTLTDLQDGRAYFVLSNGVDPMSYLSAAFSATSGQPKYALSDGWNGIGVTALAGETEISAKAYLSSVGNWRVLRSWDPENKWQTLRSSGPTATAGFDLLADASTPAVNAGQGYFLFVDGADSLAP